VLAEPGAERCRPQRNLNACFYFPPSRTDRARLRRCSASRSAIPLGHCGSESFFPAMDTHTRMSISTAIRAFRSMDRFQVTAAEVPVVICGGKTVLRNPTNRQVADCLGFNEGIDQQEMRDVIIVGAGPSGLRRRYTPRPRAPSARGRNERTWRPGGFQFKNREYLGFPTGISGQELAAAPTRRRKNSARK